MVFNVIGVCFGIASFVCVAVALILDFMDLERGNAYRKGIYLFGMLYSATILLRYAQADPAQYFWFVVTLMQMIEKVAHFQNKEKLARAGFGFLKKFLRQAHTF